MPASDPYDIRTWRPLDFGPWTPPRLTREGRTFAPAGLEIGATVRVRSRYGAEATGQVWSKTDRDGEVFVVVEELRRAVRVCARNKHTRGCMHLDHPAPAAAAA